MRKAFTLIELLVVIAIIAILAAILFPVFAQAKMAAKGTVNLSNQKQIGLSILMYGTDSDDTFPLAQRDEPSNAALFGMSTWNVDVQPYMKNWGVMRHPLNSFTPSDKTLVPWNQILHYGVVPRAENSGSTTSWGARGYFQANTGTGSFSRRICGSAPCNYTGAFGTGCLPSGSQCSLGAGDRMVPSLSQTAIANPATGLLAAEGANWDLWMQLGVENPLTYGVYWNPPVYDVGGVASFHMAGPHARKLGHPQAPDGACSPANVCDGFNLGIVNGVSTFVAADGHAASQEYRGRLMQTATLPDGTVVIKCMWPAGGF